MAKEAIKDFYGRILGYRDDQGSKVTAYDFNNRILGYYDKSSDKTSDFYHRIICSGDGTVGLIMGAGKN